MDRSFTLRHHGPVSTTGSTAPVRVIGLAFAVFAGSSAAIANHAGIWHIAGVASLNEAGQPGSGNSIFASVSRDGRYIVFDSRAADLIPDDTNGTIDIFLFDRMRDEILRISEHIDGTQGLGKEPSISADGRFIAYTSSSRDLVGTDTDNDGVCDQGCVTSAAAQVYRRDRDSNENGIYDEPGGIANELVSVNLAGEASALASESASISADGRWVAFASSVPDLVDNDTNACSGHNFPGHCPDVFVRDMETGTTVRVSVATDGTEADNASARFPANSSLAISGDGRFVVFGSRATNLVAGDTNNRDDVFLHDRDTDADGIFDEAGEISTVRVSVDSGGQELPNPLLGQNASISADGSLIVFSALGDRMDGGVNLNGDGSDIYLFDRLSGSHERTGRLAIGDETCCGNGVTRQAVSDDGRFVTYFGSKNVRLEDEQFVEVRGVPDVFVLDRTTGVTERITNSPTPTQRSDPQEHASLSVVSGDGGTLVFMATDPVLTGRTGATANDIVYATSSLFPGTTTTTMPPASACGDADGSGSLTATDALAALRTAVGSGVCALCICDVDASAAVTATDALSILQRAVGQSVVLTCVAC